MSDKSSKLGYFSIEKLDYPTEKELYAKMRRLRKYQIIVLSVWCISLILTVFQSMIENIFYIDNLSHILIGCVFITIFLNTIIEIKKNKLEKRLHEEQARILANYIINAVENSDKN